VNFFVNLHRDSKHYVMKKFAVLLTFFALTLSAQENIAPQLEKQGELIKASFFHDNGKIAQTGFLKDNKRHGSWVGYNRSGKKIAMGYFKSDKKNGQWFFWKGDELIEVIYEDNKIVNVMEWNTPKNKLIAKNN